MDKKVPIIGLIIFAIVLCITVGYSIFSVQLQIDDMEAYIRSNADYRVTNFQFDSLGSGATVEANYVEFAQRSLLTNIKLPNDDSYVKYKVKVNNLGNTYAAIHSFTNLDNDLQIVLDGYNYDEKICNGNVCTLNAEKEFYITIKYKDGVSATNSTYNLNIGLNFITIYLITYTGSGTNLLSNPPTQITAGDTLNLSFLSTPSEVKVNNVVQNITNNQLIITNVSENLVININNSNSITYDAYGGYFDDDVTNTTNVVSYYWQNNQNVIESGTLKTPKRINYLFAGWYLDTDYNDVFDINNQITSSKIVYAKWILDTVTYNISYQLNGGTQASNQVMSFMESNPQTILNPTNACCNFDGWYLNGEFTGNIITSTSQLTGNSNLFAKWSSIISNTTYDSQTGVTTVTDIPSPISVTQLTSHSYTGTNTTGKPITKIEINVSYRNNSGNRNKSLTAALYLNGSSTAAATDSQRFTTGNGSGVATFTLQATIPVGAQFTISFPSTDVNNANVSILSFKSTS